MDIKDQIEKKLKKVLEELKASDVQAEVQPSSNLMNGDYSSNVALKLSSTLKQKPLELAEKIAEKFAGDEIFEKVEAVNPGFINFFLSNKSLNENLVEILEKKDKFGNSSSNKGKKVVVEFSSPNIAKPFTVGHLRSTIIGSAIANLLSATGWEVARDNHLGDWGTQFGKQIYAIKTWGDEAQIDKSKNPVKDLVELYVRFHEEAEKNPEIEDDAREWFKKLESHDEEATRIWKKCIDWSMREFDRLYKTLGISFTENDGLGYGESFFEDKMAAIIDELKSKNLLKESEGAELVFFPDDKYPPLMILKKDGTSLYATRDLATDKFRLELHGKDTVIINEVGAEQALYFNQLYELEKMLGWVHKDQRIHIKHGHFRFAEGKMSTRKGNVVWLEDVLSEAEKRAKDLSKENTDSKAIAIGAIKWNDLKRDVLADIIFDWDDILNMQGNSGPYVQYAYVRTQSILKKSDNAFAGKTTRDSSNIEKEEKDLLRLLVRFPEIVEFAAQNFSPNTVATYLFDLAQMFNLFYQKHQILNASDEDVRSFRLALTSATGQVIQNGLNLLGIETVERM